LFATPAGRGAFETSPEEVLDYERQTEAYRTSDFEIKRFLTGLSKPARNHVVARFAFRQRQDMGRHRFHDLLIFF
jgi:hypothetical protein